MDEYQREQSIEEGDIGDRQTGVAQKVDALQQPVRQNLDQNFGLSEEARKKARKEAKKKRREQEKKDRVHKNKGRA